MDIARSPSTPDGNPEMADAPPMPTEPPVIRREDYKPFPWRVPTTRLDSSCWNGFDRVTATLAVEPNPDADATSDSIRPSGDGLEPVTVEVDGQGIEQLADGRRRSGDPAGPGSDTRSRW